MHQPNRCTSQLNSHPLKKWFHPAQAGPHVVGVGHHVLLRCTSSSGVMSGDAQAGGTIYPLTYVIQSR